ncbi:MAG: serine hydroxymethyltransferase [Candidatus Hodgkinia cicadicola]|nr:MAG: serine hydroxymethyltransferase [Candidatus Hodgkinia cicadicola]
MEANGRDVLVATALRNEVIRQTSSVELIASENIASAQVLEAQGSVFTNKYAEGYPFKRYYGGCKFADEVEALAIARAKLVFNCRFANVQPHSGSQMNQAVFLALLSPGDTIMGLDLKCGGHLTHGSPVNLSGKWFSAVSYGVRRHDGLVDMDEVLWKALVHRPKLIITGATAYARVWDWEKFRLVADLIGAVLLADISHIAGLVAANLHSSPFPHCHIVTTTTHNSLRGPRGGLILTNEADLAKKIDLSVFPGLQGGPLVHAIAAKAVALFEALQPGFKLYARSVVANAKAMCCKFGQLGVSVVSGGTDNHLVLLSLSAFGITGKQLEAALDRCHIFTNNNCVPFDARPPTTTSGLRLGSCSCSTRGMKEPEFEALSEVIFSVLTRLSSKRIDFRFESSVRAQVFDLADRFPFYLNRLY